MRDLITKEQEYALRAMRNIATVGRGVMVRRKDMATEENIPPHFLAKILQNISRNGVIEIVQGSQGGPVLLKNPETVTVLEVLELCSGPLRFDRGDNGKISMIMSAAEDCLNFHFTRYKIADLVEEE